MKKYIVGLGLLVIFALWAIIFLHPVIISYITDSWWYLFLYLAIYPEVIIGLLITHCIIALLDYIEKL